MIESAISRVKRENQEKLEAKARLEEKGKKEDDIISFLEEQLKENGAEYVKEHVSEWHSKWEREFKVSRKTIERITRAWRDTILRRALDDENEGSKKVLAQIS